MEHEQLKQLHEMIMIGNWKKEQPLQRQLYESNRPPTHRDAARDS